MKQSFYASPVGMLRLISDGSSLIGLEFHDDAPNAPNDDDAVLRLVTQQLREYFDGERTEFDLPLKPAGTPFQLAVWKALRAIPYGETTSYQEVARRIGKPTASRAVGAANGVNPLAIIVPCHRVIGASGTLVGYGGGLDRKRRLLRHENCDSPLFAETESVAAS